MDVEKTYPDTETITSHTDMDITSNTDMEIHADEELGMASKNPRDDEESVEEKSRVILSLTAVPSGQDRQSKEEAKIKAANGTDTGRETPATSINPGSSDRKSREFVKLKGTRGEKTKEMAVSRVLPGSSLEEQSRVILDLTAVADPKVCQSKEQAKIRESRRQNKLRKEIQSHSVRRATIGIDDSKREEQSRRTRHSRRLERISLRMDSSSNSFKADTVPGAYREGSKSDRSSSAVRSHTEISKLSGHEQRIASENSKPARETSKLSADENMIVSAIKVEDPEDQTVVEERVRESILREAVEAQVVVPEDIVNLENKRSRKFWLMSASLICIGVSVALAVGLSLGLASSSAEAAPAQPIEDGDGKDVIDPGTEVPTSLFLEPTLEAVMNRGAVRCGIYDDMPGFSLRTSDGNFTGFNYALCRAIAVAALGDGDKVERVIVNPANRFAMLASGEIDLISQTVSITMERDVLEATTGVGFTFSYPFYYSGLAFGGVPEFVECADRLDPFNGICRDLRVCVVRGTTQDTSIMSILPGSVIVRVDSPFLTIPNLNDGTCNAIAAEALTLNPAQLEGFGLSSELNFKVGEQTFSRDPLALVTRDDDSEWSSLVNSVIKILYTAEALNITKETVGNGVGNAEGLSIWDGLLNTTGLSEQLSKRIESVISEVGNYGELYKREAEAYFPRGGANSLNSGGDTGLLYSYAFGKIDREVGNISANSEVIDDIRSRGFLRCGVVVEEVFARYEVDIEEYSGLDVEYCRVIAVALFIDDSDRIEFVELDSTTTFQALSNNLVDLVVGQEITLANEFSEMTTGQAFSFSEPYFWEAAGKSRAMATRIDDSTWASFVYWMSRAPEYAEEMGISSQNPISMPPVTLFGQMALQSFRDVVAAIGNYEEIYNRTIADLFPRRGRNLLNIAPFGPQQVGYAPS